MAPLADGTGLRVEYLVVRWLSCRLGLVAVVRRLLLKRAVRHRLAMELLRRVCSVKASSYRCGVYVGRLLELPHLCMACGDIVVLLLVLRWVMGTL